jgi:asparagine synthase (glutamine-hydrolysing)
VSAICGAIGLDGRPFGESDLDGVMAALAPLGPDGRGAWCGPVGRMGAVVGAALRQRTLEDAADRQPAWNAARSIALVGDLRIDNRAELAAALGTPHGTAVPDSAIVLAAYERWGEPFLERLAGAFAIAIVDLDRGGVLLARDHLGLQPLVVHERPGVVAFASNALSLTAFEGVGHRLDMRRAAEILALAYHSERTMVEGVRWVPPAGAMWVDGSRTRRWAWWRPELHATRDHDSPETFERELRDALDQAVRSRLRSTGAVGVMSSGGLDSTSVAATAAEQLAPDPLRTYTAAPRPGWAATPFRGWDADESPIVRELAVRHPNIVPAVVRVEHGPSILGRHERLWELGGGPERNPCNSLWMHAVTQRASEDGVTTLLTGARGNYFFSAHGEEWLIVLLRAGRLWTLGREAYAWSRATGRPIRGVLRHHLIAPFEPASLKRARRRRRGKPGAVEEWLEETALRPEAAVELDLPRLRPALDDSRRPDPRLVTFTAALTGGAQAETGLALETLFGVESRDPTADRRLIEAALRQPEWVRRHDGIGRAVARAAMAGRLPPSIVRRRRRGEQLPDWLDVMTAARPELATEVDALANHAPSRELIDVDRLRRLVSAWPDRLQNAERQTIRDYRHVLPRAVTVSRYLRWFERRAG